MGVQSASFAGPPAVRSRLLPASLPLLLLLLLRWCAVCRAQCESPCEGVGSYSLAKEPLPKDCKDILDRGLTKSGVYTIFPQDVYLCVSLRVYCDMDTDGGGWTVFQRRYDNRFDFYRRWMDYRLGFGSLGSEFWLGNEHLNHITVQDDYLLRVELEDMDGERSFATYAGFRVGEETENYRLYLGNFTGGDAGDSLGSHRGSPFATSDSDPSGGRCPTFRGGCWWYPRMCGDSNLNGRHRPGERTDYGEGVMWRSWRGLAYSLPGTELKFRPMVEADRARPQENEQAAGEEGGGEGEGDEEEETSVSSVSSSSADDAEEVPVEEEMPAATPAQPPSGTVKGSVQPRKNEKKKNKSGRKN